MRNKKQEDVDQKMMDRDLDIVNTMKGFPDTEEDCFLFVRGRLYEDNDDMQTFVNYQGSPESFALSIANIMDSNEDIKEILLDGVRTFLSGMEDEMDTFISELTEARSTRESEIMKTAVDMGFMEHRHQWREGGRIKPPCTDLRYAENGGHPLLYDEKTHDVIWTRSEGWSKIIIDQKGIETERCEKLN